MNVANRTQCQNLWSKQTPPKNITAQSSVCILLCFSCLLNVVRGEGETESSESWSIVAGKYCAIIALVMASGLFSGLSLGLLGLDKIGLEIIAHGGNAAEAAHAKKIIPLRKDGNCLLCTLVLCNVAVNALLSILMAGLTNGIVGFFLSTAVITIFGEIFPQAVCSRHALQIGAFVVPFVKFLVLILWPACKPISYLLDKMLGEEVGTIHSRLGLQKLLQIHVKYGALDVETGREIEGALHYKDIEVSAVMTPKDKVFMLSSNDHLNFHTLSEIFKSGFSRIPVFGSSHNDIVGLLFTKDLIFVDPEDETPVQNFIEIFGRSVHLVWPDQRLGEILKLFKQGRAHVAIVRDVNNMGPGDPFYEMVGIITLEDIVENILGDDILDETDIIHRRGEILNRVDRKGLDLSRLKLMIPDAVEDSLSSAEANAVAAHLCTNVVQFKDFSRDSIKSIVSISTVVNMRRAVKNGTFPTLEDYLYRNGEVSSFCTLVLTGRLQVITGKDEFNSDIGPWSVLAADSLLHPEGFYKPNFSAYLCTDTLRFVRITRESFERVKLISTNLDRFDLSLHQNINVLTNEMLQNEKGCNQNEESNTRVEIIPMLLQTETFEGLQNNNLKILANEMNLQEKKDGASDEIFSDHLITNDLVIMANEIKQGSENCSERVSSDFSVEKFAVDISNKNDLLEFAKF